MKKLLVLFFILVLGLAGCNFYSAKNGEKPKNPVNTEPGKTIDGTKSPNEAQKNNNEKEYYLGAKVQPREIIEWAKRYQEYEGVYQQKIGNYRGVLINLGYTPNPGYKVEIEKVVKKADKWSVEVSLKEPEPGKIYSEVISYPYNIISIIDDGKPIEVLKAKGNKQKVLPSVIIPVGQKLAASSNFLVTSPLINGKITSPVTIKGKARVFEANFRIHIEDGHNYLAQKVLMADEGAPAFGDFNIKLSFDEPTNPYGSIVLSYANMANGKMIEELIIPVKF